MNTPALDKIIRAAFDKAEIDTPEWAEAEAMQDELASLKFALKEKIEAHEATSKALYQLQFVTHEELLNKYCAIRDAMKAMVEAMGYTVKAK
jgi:hypothetical protein